MKITVFTRYNEQDKWGGDLRALYTMAQGMRQLGCEVDVISDFSQFTASDMLFLSNSCLSLMEHYRVLSLLRQPYSLIGFHEDRIKYEGVSYGLFHYIRGCLDNACDPQYPDVLFSLEALLEKPHLIHYYTILPRKQTLLNDEAVKHAHVCIANSEQEAQTLQRDFPSCQPQVVRLTAGAVAEFHPDPTEEFLAFTGLQSNQYILQVGRFEPRKNQLATILATRNSDIPLVLIATQGGIPNYETTCLEAIIKWRKAPTLVISQSLAEMDTGSLRVMAMPHRDKLSLSMLHSAFAHAALHLHPAFMELPGYTYFESAFCGTPTVASSWATIGEYFSQPTFDDRIEYALPYDIAALTALVEKKIGRRYSRAPAHPSFKRTKEDVAREILGHLANVPKKVEC